MSQSGRGSPWVTTTDGTNNVIVWVVGAEGDQRLHGYNGDTGAVVYAGGGANELMTGTRKWNTGMVARGRIYVANDNKVYAFRFPPEERHAYSYSNCYVHSDCDSDCNGNGNIPNGHRDCDSRATSTATRSSVRHLLPQPGLQEPDTTPRQSPLRDPIQHRSHVLVRCQGRAFRASDQLARAFRVHVRRPCQKQGLLANRISKEKVLDRKHASRSIPRERK